MKDYGFVALATSSNALTFMTYNMDGYVDYRGGKGIEKGLYWLLDGYKANTVAINRYYNGEPKEGVDQRKYLKRYCKSHNIRLVEYGHDDVHNRIFRDTGFSSSRDLFINNYGYRRKNPFATDATCAYFVVGERLGYNMRSDLTPEEVLKKYGLESDVIG